MLGHRLGFLMFANLCGFALGGGYFTQVKLQRCRNGHPVSRCALDVHSAYHFIFGTERPVLDVSLLVGKVLAVAGQSVLRISVFHVLV